MTNDERIVVIGAGNMATRLSIAIDRAGYDIIQIYNRTLSAAEALSNRLQHHVPVTDDLATVRNDATIYLFSVSDSALPSLVEQLPANDALWLHTAGSMPMETFCKKTPHYGVLYPMQTVKKERDVDWSEVPIFIEAAQEADIARIEAIATKLSRRVIRSNSDQRKAVHLAAVFACNFANHMYAIAEQLLKAHGISFDVMKLLIRETEMKAEQIAPIDAQTGPATRRDENVMEKHIALLEGTPEEELYRLISRNIERYAQLNNTKH